MPLTRRREGGYTIFMKALRVLILIGCVTVGTPAHAAFRLAPPPVKALVPFVPNYVGSLAISLGQQPFFAGKVLGAFDVHLAKVTPMTRPEELAEYLRSEILGEGAVKVAPAQLVRSLGRESIEANKASALLLANALARPDQFEEVLAEMEALKPTWGQRVAAAMANAESAGGAPVLLNRLREVGKTLRPNPSLGLYDSHGRLEGLFDGSK